MSFPHTLLPDPSNRTPSTPHLMLYTNNATIVYPPQARKQKFPTKLAIMAGKQYNVRNVINSTAHNPPFRVPKQRRTTDMIYSHRKFTKQNQVSNLNHQKPTSPHPSSLMV
jgi:hypothetical protein